MTWIKKGLIYSPPKKGGWRHSSALTPTAFLVNEEVIRVFASFRDDKGVGRIGYVDVDASNPGKILAVSSKPVLDVGAKGMFDDNGVILGDVIRVNDKVYMYYVGFQLVNQVKFLAYTGLAISSDNGNSFSRVQQTPILDRADEGLYIRAIHSVIFEGGIFKVWYATGNGWEDIGGVAYPQYDINYMESVDGVTFSREGIKCIENDSSNKEYRIGRPRVYTANGSYIMNFTYGTTDGKYIAGQAVSTDGISWKRGDDEIGISLSNSGWDSKHLSYPSVISVSGRTYMFYNGNDMGETGFGYAKSEVHS